LFRSFIPSIHCKEGNNKTTLSSQKFRENLKATRGVAHCGFAIYSKTYFKAKEEL
jgi:hypothetical protein